MSTEELAKAIAGHAIRRQGLKITAYRETATIITRQLADDHRVIALSRLIDELVDYIAKDIRVK